MSEEPAPTGSKGNAPSPPSTGGEPAPRRHPVLLWGERALTAAILVFVFYRLGPQLGALTGVGPDLGRAPDYAFVSLDGNPIDSDDLIGQVVVLNFWATWCGPCKLEMPSLQAVHEDRATEGVVVLGLATDAGGVGGVRAFLDERDITYTVGRATNAHRQAFGGVPVIPTTFLIDRRGVVRHRVVGYLTPPALRAAVNRLLAEKPNTAASGMAGADAVVTSSAGTASGR